MAVSRKTKRLSVVLMVLLSAFPGFLTVHGAVVKLADGWKMQSSAAVTATGAEISVSAYQPAQWYAVTVPSTVLAGLVANNVYQDIYFGKNLGSVNTSAFASSWWYRTVFAAPQRTAADRVWLDLKGINHRANIWINGKQLAASTSVFGCFRTYEFDITDFCNAGGAENVLAVEVFKPVTGDLTIYYVDWAPAPPDGNMGIYRDVFVRTSGPVKLGNPFVATRFDPPSLATAHLTVAVDVTNPTAAAVQTTIRGRIGEVTFSRTLSVSANQTVEAVFSSDSIPQLTIANPRVWWPWQYGDQPLYDLLLTAEVNGAASDSSQSRFGIRQVESVKSTEGYTIFKVNGKRILIRGAGWCPDLLQRYSAQEQEDHLRYIRHLNLNAVRQEGKFEDRNFYDLCDAYGIFVMAGWCCCDKWEQWASWNSTDQANAYESLRSMVRELRRHPSSLVWCNGSDYPPPDAIAQQYAAILSQLRWPNPVLSNATLAQNSGVKMLGPYEWVPPNYWLTDVSKGGAFGFATEIGPGPAVPPLASLQRMLPQDHLWPIDDYWNYHCGGSVFSSVAKFTNALTARYGAATSARDYAVKAQVAAYESHRAMFEGYGRNKYHSTGVIQWMLNNAWPSMIWHLYDYFMRPGGSYFGARIACEPLHIQYSYDTRSVAVVNSYATGFSNLKAIADVYSLDGTARSHTEAAVSVLPDSVSTAFAIPAVSNLSTTYFLRLTLQDSGGAVQSMNSYWLSTVSDVINFGAADWYYTPVSSYADLKGLQTLSSVTLETSSVLQPGQNGEEGVAVTIKNPASGIAFSVHLSLLKGQGQEELLPVLWSDNYFMLLPGEQRVITATYLKKDLGTSALSVVVDGWNVTGVEVPLGTKRPPVSITNANRPSVCDITVFDCSGRAVGSFPMITGNAFDVRARAGRFLSNNNQRLAAGVYMIRISAKSKQGTSVEYRRLVRPRQ
jgi:exo-1,4-beta-D-glucosaminidase